MNEQNVKAAYVTAGTANLTTGKTTLRGVVVTNGTLTIYDVTTPGATTLLVVTAPSTQSVVCLLPFGVQISVKLGYNLTAGSATIFYGYE